MAKVCAEESNDTNGSISLSDVLSEGGTEAAIKIDQGIEEVGNAKEQVDTRWGGLSQLEQNNKQPCE
ncbi:MAG: hypothetical protein OEV24_08700 [Cyclobacteriaceae bacterium]|jgi:fructose-bisphosphate aldolase class 1|nr:hypothetical protein [Cyclobacteriaceae bacterium]MDH5251075.1 hypothetical protein [Cyclobacteriaceae bacterium]